MDKKISQILLLTTLILALTSCANPFGSVEMDESLNPDYSMQQSEVNASTIGTLGIVKSPDDQTAEQKNTKPVVAESIYFSHPDVNQQPYIDWGIVPTPGFKLFTNTLSHNNQMLVYSEVKLYYDENNFEKADYNIYFKKKDQPAILLHECHNSFKSDFCVLPHAWSKNDQIMIFGTSYLLGGSGGAHVGDLFARSIDQIDVEYYLAPYTSHLNRDYSKVIYTETNETSPLYCGPGEQVNDGKLFVKDIEKNIVDFYEADKNIDYRIKEVENDSFVFQKVETFDDTADNGICGVREGEIRNYRYDFNGGSYRAVK